MRVMVKLIGLSIVLGLSHQPSYSDTLSFLSNMASSCRGRYPVDVSVNYIAPKFSVESTENLSDESQGLAALDSNWTINGLTVGVLQGGISIRGSERDGCFYPSAIRLNFEYEDPIKIHILSKYKPGSCNYNVILNHELVHFNIFKNAPMKLDRHIRESAIAAIDHYFKFYLREGKGTQETFFHLLQLTINGLTRDINTYSEVKHARIDTREAYMQQASLCATW